MRYREVKKGMKVKVCHNKGVRCFPRHYAYKRFIGMSGVVRDIKDISLSYPITVKIKNRLRYFSHKELQLVKSNFFEDIKDIGLGIIKIQEENRKLKNTNKQLQKGLKEVKSKV